MAASIAILRSGWSSKAGACARLMLPQLLILASSFSAHLVLAGRPQNAKGGHRSYSLADKVMRFLWNAGKSSYEPVWPVSKIILFFCCIAC
ncbi:hypothetical protein MLD38_007265 [Melastoma candidum]|uniref:Uncharacterized protein n=1 Tax=Melastoma candidum TaxID=119954 RepID=A0ACB9RQP6_9MYRT|nr:hypothetical protein MLD38_007265 [Melastoma candidum]